MGATVNYYPPVAGPWTPVTVTGAAVTDITISDLNGETDGGYEFYFDFLGASSTPTYSLQPNALATNQTGTATYNNGTTISVSNQTILFLGFGGTAVGSRCRGHYWFTSKTGFYRELQGIGHTGIGTGIASQQLFNGAFTWNESVTAITSLVFHSSVADGIAVGSVVYWRKLGTPF